MTNELNAIKARLGSISPVTLRHLSPAVQRLLTKDMEYLLLIAEKYEGLEWYWANKKPDKPASVSQSNL